MRKDCLWNWTDSIRLNYIIWKGLKHGHLEVSSKSMKKMPPSKKKEKLKWTEKIKYMEEIMNIS